MRPVFVVAATVALFATAPLAAQGASDHAAFLSRLGNDTVLVERFTRTAQSIEGDVVIRSPRTRLIHYQATLAPDGTVARFESSSRLGGAAAGPPSQSAVAIFTGDSVTVQIRIGDSTRTLHLAAHHGAVPTTGAGYALWEQGIRQAVASGKDSMPLDLVFIGSSQATPTYVSRRGPESVAVGYFGNPAMVRIDKVGRMLSFDGAQTTVKVMVQRLPDIDIDAIAQSFAAADAAGHALGQLSPRDTVRAEIAGGHLWVDYGRPSRRGRVIFGGIVPWNQVWRTGANAATQFNTDVALRIGSADLAPGTYTFWTLPSASGAKLIINKQHGQWGTEYDASQDLARVDLTSEPVQPLAEQFTITLDPDNGGLMLRMTWEGTRYSVPIRGR